ncbi:MAG: hypothetical protein AAF797_05240 [Planctomycetota bacterium]
MTTQHYRFVLYAHTAMAGLLLMLISTPAAALDIDTDFTELARPIEVVKPDKNLSIRGHLPRGWAQDAGWQSDLTLRFKRLTVQGRTGMRVTKQGNGQIQLRHTIPTLTPGRYRLTITGRNPDQLQIIAGVRQIGPGYLWSYRTQCTFGDEWQREVHEFTLNKPIADSAFYLLAKGPSNTAIDLAEFKLEQLTPDRILAELRQRYPDGGPSNLFRDTTLDQGLASGWSMTGRDYVGITTQTRVVEDDQTPSGIGRAFEIESRDEAAPLNSAPFPIIQRDRPHTVSFFAKGQGQWKAEVHYDGGKQIIASKAFALTPDWQRVTLTFTPDLFRARAYLHLRGRGLMRVDGFQAEAGRQATTFHRSHPVGLSLVLTNGVNPRAAVLVGHDTPARLSLGLEPAGHQGPTTVRLRVHNAYGEATDVSPLSVTASAYTQAQAEITPSSDHPLGPFRVEAWVEDANGQRISAFQELVFIRVPPPIYGGRDAPDSFFGTHSRPSQSRAELLKSIGVNWVRLHDQGKELVMWAFLEPEPGQWTFRDDLLQTYRDAHLSVLGVLSSTPVWAAHINNPQDMTEADKQRYFARYFLPRDQADWQNYVRTVAERYRDDIRVWDLWNEPWGGGFMNDRFVPSGRGKGMFRGPAQDVRIQRYFELGRTAHAALQQVDPELRLVVDISKPHFVEQAITDGATDFADVFAIHRYVGGSLGHPGDAFSKTSSEAADAARTVGTPLWMTEGSGSNITHRSGFYHHTLAGVRLEDDPIHNAQQMSRYLLSNLGLGVEKVFTYAANYSTFSETNTPWTVLLMEGGAPHPSAAAHAVLAHQLDGKHILKQHEIRKGLYVHVFAAEDSQQQLTLVLTRTEQADETEQLVGPIPNAVDVFGNRPTAGQPPLTPLFIQLEIADDQALADALKRWQETLAIRRGSPADHRSE